MRLGTDKDKTGPIKKDKTRPIQRRDQKKDQTKQDKTRQDKTRPDQTRAEQTTQHKTTQHTTTRPVHPMAFVASQSCSIRPRASKVVTSGLGATGFSFFEAGVGATAFSFFAVPSKAVVAGVGTTYFSFFTAGSDFSFFVVPRVNKKVTRQDKRNNDIQGSARQQHKIKKKKTI
jgi:hypothetical protein